MLDGVTVSLLLTSARLPTTDADALGGLLRFVSPIFKDMFDLNRGTAAEQRHNQNGFPVIPLSSNGRYHNTSFCPRLLVSLYLRAQLDDFTLVWKVCKAAKKYCMDIEPEIFKGVYPRSSLGALR